jgi:hypothetical protein
MRRIKKQRREKLYLLYKLLNLPPNILLNEIINVLSVYTKIIIIIIMKLAAGFSRNCFVGLRKLSSILSMLSVFKIVNGH